MALCTWPEIVGAEAVRVQWPVQRSAWFEMQWVKGERSEQSV